MEAVFGDELEVLAACEKIKRDRIILIKYNTNENME